MIKVKQTDQLNPDITLCVLFNELHDLEDMDCTAAEKNFIRNSLTKPDKRIIILNQYKRFLILLPKPKEVSVYQKSEKLRILGSKLLSILKENNISEIQIENATPTTANALDLLEGLVLTAYSFSKYKSNTEDNFQLKNIWVYDFSLTKDQLKTFNACMEAVYMARDWVNEPASVLTSTEFVHRSQKLSEQYGLKLNVWDEKDLQEAKMGGILAVNQGSTQPPYFLIVEYKPKKPVHEKPLVFVGKGVVYDTGGYSLKPADSLDWMKCDMAGAAVVLATTCYAAATKLPLHIITLIPLTDNRLDGEALVPGDIITISNGKTVEVLNTDAEGRLILADALVYAQKLDPLLVIDVATLTGAALRAIGSEGMVFMGTAPENQKAALLECGLQTHERLAEFPMWEEYDEQLKSDIADLRNIGGDTAGAITAGMFLKHFTNYPWIHIDIAGVAFLRTAKHYRPKNGSGMGVRLLSKFIEKLSHPA